MFRNNFSMGNGASAGDPHPQPGSQGKMFISCEILRVYKTYLNTF